MITRAVAQRLRLGMVQAADNGEMLAIRLKRLEGRGRDVVFAQFLREEIIHVHAVGHVDNLQALAVAGRRLGGIRTGDHRFQQRKREQGAHAPKQGTAGERLAGDNHLSGVLLMSKGTLVTMPMMMSFMRYPSFSAA